MVSCPGPSSGATVAGFATLDHGPEDKKEAARIARAGGVVECGAGGEWRVLVPTTEGVFQVGDAHFQHTQQSSDIRKHEQSESERAV